MRVQQTSEANADGAPSSPPLVAIGAAVLAVLLAGGGLLWARFGEAVYIDRILTAIANCF